MGIPKLLNVVFIFSSCVCVHAIGANEIVEISPHSAVLPVTGVPFLHEVVTEATAPDHGLAIEPRTPFQWILRPAPDAVFTVKIRVEESLFDRGVLTLWNWNNRPIGQWEIKSGEPAGFDFRVEGKGVYQCTLDGYREGVCERRLVRSFAVVPDLRGLRDQWRIDEFFLGVCAFPGRYHWSFQGVPSLPLGISEEAAREREAEAMAALGFQVVRVDESMEMGTTDDPENPYQFDFRRMDEAVDAYVSRGFRLALQLMNAPDWATADRYRGLKGPLWRYPKRETPQRAYVDALVSRYGEDAAFVQIFNEPDQSAFWAGTPQEYVHHFLFSKKEVQNSFPEIRIANGGYSLFEPVRTRYLVERLRGLVDLPAYHSHGMLDRLKEDHDRVTQWHGEAGYPANIRLINSEMGFDGWRLDQELRKGQFVPQKTLYCWSTNHAGVLLFGSRMTLGPQRVTQDFGFLDHWFCPRYVYGSISGMVSTLAGASFAETLQEVGGVHIYRFERDEETILAGFANGEPRKVAVELSAEEGVWSDEMGNVLTRISSNRWEWSLREYPTYLSTPGVAKLEGGGVAPAGGPPPKPGM